MEVQASAKAKAMQSHDYFNIISLFFICNVNALYLHSATDWSKIGTDGIGAEHERLFYANILLFIIYMILDSLWVIFQPICVNSNPQMIIIHHLVTLIMTLVPWRYPRFAWHFAVCILVEINTWFLTLKRNLPIGSFSFQLCEILFYISWVALRLILFPILVLFYVSEYVRFSQSYGSFLNIVVISPSLQFLVTCLSFKWTVDMLRKRQRSKRE